LIPKPINANPATRRVARGAHRKRDSLNHETHEAHEMNT
jgi:hypothetical protein